MSLLFIDILININIIQYYDNKTQLLIISVIKLLSKACYKKNIYSKCIKCGCKSMFDLYNDRNCWCDSCSCNKCIYYLHNIHIHYPVPHIYQYKIVIYLNKQYKFSDYIQFIKLLKHHTLIVDFESEPIISNVLILHLHTYIVYVHMYGSVFSHSIFNNYYELFNRYMYKLHPLDAYDAYDYISDNIDEYYYDLYH